MDKEAYDTDKSETGLLEVYSTLFEPIRRKKITLLEIGIFRGGSLDYFSEYFEHPESRIVGVDLHLPDKEHPSNVSVHQCDQNDQRSLRKIAKHHGPFDIIIDDGSHFAKETASTFSALFESVATNGYYVIEDWAVGYWKDHPESRYKGMVEVVTGIVSKAPQLRIDELEIKLALHQAIAIFHKGEEGWRH